jgi:hypothetical protein
MKVPPDAVVVICKEIREALNLIPTGVLLTPEKYQALLDRIERLERQVRAAVPEIPSVCKLTGQAEGELARLQAQFEFRTQRPKTVVVLGCQRAWLTPGATLDGKLPLLLTSEDGQLKVQVETEGAHQLTLDLELPLTARGSKGSEQGFDLGLPRAAITTLESFQLARPLSEVRVNGRSVRTKSHDGQNRLAAVPLGPVDRLEMAWKVPQSSSKKSPTQLEATGKWGVRVTESSLITDVELNLQALGGECREWRVQFPPQMVPEVKEPRPLDERIESVDLPDAKNPFLILRLKEASGEPLRVVFQVRQLRGKAPVPIGPFVVPGALRQRGTIDVAASPDVRLRFHLRGDVQQREIADEARRENMLAAFTYGNLATSATMGATVPAPLEMLVEDVKGVVEGRLEHHLALTDQGWRATTKIVATPVRIRIDHVDLELPSTFQYDRTVGPSPTELVDGVELDERGSSRQVAQIKLVKEQSQPFAVTIPGTYPLGERPFHALLDLPRPLNMLDRGAQLTVTLPESMELVFDATGSDVAVPGERQHTWRWERWPERFEVAWRPFRSELPVEAIADLTVLGRQSQVRHRIRFLQAPPKSVVLSVPAAIADRVRVTEGGTLEPNGLLRLADAAGKDHSVILTYSFPLSDGRAEPPEPAELERGVDQPPQAGRPMTRQIRVPLVRVLDATRSETKVRVWSEPGTVPLLLQGPWEEQPTESVADQDALPSLVLRSGSSTLPLTIGLSEAASVPLAAVVVHHALIHVAVSENGSQSYDVRFLVNRFNGRELEVELPAPPARLNPVVSLDGKKVLLNRGQGSGDRGLTPDLTPTEGATVARLEIEPDLYRRPIIVEIHYEVPPGAIRGSNPIATTLRPPLLRGALFLGQARWQVELPSAWICVYQGGSNAGEQNWSWHGGLLKPRPALTGGDLNHWLLAEAGNGSPLRESIVRRGETEPSLVGWQAEPGPVLLVHVRQAVWLLACSLVFLLLSLGLSFAPLTRGHLWFVVILFAVAGGIASILGPSSVPAIVYGCEPGAVVLLVILGIQWVLHHRYRRQVVFLPSFTRLKPGSSLSRRDSNARKGAQPSTVDAPNQRENSSKQRIEDNGS